MELSTLAADDNWLSADSAASTAADTRSDGTTIVFTVIAGAALGPVAAQQGNEPRAASTRGVVWVALSRYRRSYTLPDAH